MERPNRYDKEVIEAAARKIAVRCAEWSNGETSADEWVDDLIRCKHYWRDGYELTKEMDDRCHVMGADAYLVEALTDAAFDHDEAHRDAVKAWVTEHGFAPAFVEGQRVSTPHGNGTIYKINLETAQYTVALDGHSYGGGGGHIINAEMVGDEVVPA